MIDVKTGCGFAMQMVSASRDRSGGDAAAKRFSACRLRGIGWRTIRFASKFVS